MFGLSQLFAAIRRLTESINHSAELVDSANQQLETRLLIVDEPAPAPAIEHDRSNGRTRKVPVPR